MVDTLHRPHGDHGAMARIRALFKDKSGEPVTVGTVTFKAYNHAGILFALEGTHEGEGWWYVDPPEDAIGRPGGFSLELTDGAITVPPDQAATLRVRPIAPQEPDPEPEE